jgi:hypothetical protein
MNRLVKTSVILAIMLFVFSANAQKPEFDALVHDFGTITEDLGSVTHSFKFKNTGDKPLIITTVQASCGCTTPGWTKEPVKPGESGEILATYKTSTGIFNKSLTVTASGLPDVILYIKGNVVKKTDSVDVRQIDSAKVAGVQKLKFDEPVHDFGAITEDLGSVTHSFKFTNTGDKPLIITKVQASCGCTTSKWTTEPVKPGETGEVMATYKTSVGAFDKSLTVTADGLPDVILHIKGNVVEKQEYLAKD